MPLTKTHNKTKYSNNIEKNIPKFIDATKSIFAKQAVWQNNLLIVKVNEEYPYVYTRDLAILIKFLVEENQEKLARGAINFLLKCQLDNGEWVQRYNDSFQRQEDKLQEDNTPLAVWAILSYIKKFSSKKLPGYWNNKIDKALTWISNNLNNDFDLLYSHSSNHEDGINEGFELWTNSVTAKSFWLASKIIGDDKYRSQYKKIKEAILKLLVKNNRFIRKIDKNNKKYLEADIILLSPFYFDLVENNHKYLKNSASYIQNNLYDKDLGGYWRYEDDVYFPGPWIIYSAILANYYYNIDSFKKADKILSWIMEQSQNGNLPEHLVSRKEFKKHKDHQIKRAQNMPVEKMKKTRLKAIKKLEEKLDDKRVVGYAIPILWSHIETARALKSGEYIKSIEFNNA